MSETRWLSALVDKLTANSVEHRFLQGELDIRP